MQVLLLELLQLFFGVFSAHCSLFHLNAEHSHAYPQISTISNRKESFITYEPMSKTNGDFCINGHYLNSIVPVKF